MSCQGCNPNREFNEVVNKAKQDAIKNATVYAVYFDGQAWQYILYKDAAGLPVNLIVSQFTAV